MIEDFEEKKGKHELVLSHLFFQGSCKLAL